MSQDINETRLIGTVDRIRPVPTKDGTSTCEILLKVNQNKFRVTASDNLSDYLLSACGPGDRLSVTGSLFIANWKDAGRWRDFYTIQAWTAEVHGNKISYKRKDTPAQNCTRHLTDHKI